MASYGWNYATDSGLTLPNVKLSTFFVDLSKKIVGSPYGGERVSTTIDTDLKYLPEMLKTARVDGLCDFPFDAPRHCRCYVLDDLYLYVPLPFKGTTTEFMETLRQLNDNRLFRLVELHGEHVGTGYTLPLANRV